MTRRRRVIGCSTAWTKLGSVIAFRNEDHEALLEAWKAGRAFFDGYGFHGEPQTIKLGDVIYVRLYTPEAMTAGREEDLLDAQDDKADEMITGGP